MSLTENVSSNNEINETASTLNNNGTIEGLRKSLGRIAARSILGAALLAPSLSAFAGELVNINTANAAELNTIFGMNAVKAESIVKYRTENGDFKSVEDLIKVPLIGEYTMKNIRISNQVIIDEEVAGDQTNINTADIDQLAQIEGIDPFMAICIIRYREEKGDYESVEDLIKVRSVNEEVLEMIRNKVTTGVSSSNKPAVKPTVQINQPEPTITPTEVDKRETIKITDGTLKPMTDWFIDNRRRTKEAEAEVKKGGGNERKGEFETTQDYETRIEIYKKAQRAATSPIISEIDKAWFEFIAPASLSSFNADTGCFSDIRSFLSETYGQGVDYKVWHYITGSSRPYWVKINIIESDLASVSFLKVSNPTIRITSKKLCVDISKAQALREASESGKVTSHIFLHRNVEGSWFAKGEFLLDGEPIPYQSEETK